MITKIYLTSMLISVLTILFIASMKENSNVSMKRQRYIQIINILNIVLVTLTTSYFIYSIYEPNVKGYFIAKVYFTFLALFGYFGLVFKFLYDVDINNKTEEVLLNISKLFFILIFIILIIGIFLLIWT